MNGVRAGIALAAVCATCWVVQAEEGAAGTAEKMDEVAKGWSAIPEIEVSVDFCTRQITYGLADNTDPIVTPGFALDWNGFTFEGAFILDTTDWGKKAEAYGDRSWKYQEFTFGPGYGYTFSPDDWSILPTSVDVCFNYLFETHPRVRKDRGYSNPNTQLANVEIGLPDLWIEPVFSAEFDTERDHGTYLNLSIGHTFELIGPRKDGDDPELALSVRIGQGLGDPARCDGYLSGLYETPGGAENDMNRWALLDAGVTVGMDWAITDYLVVSPYITYSDIVSPSARGAARYYAYDDDDSWQIYGGVTLAVHF